jgi:hypothetical protein
MSNEFEIYWTDLTEEAKADLLKAAGLKSASEANWDAFPIATVILGEDNVN